MSPEILKKLELQKIRYLYTNIPRAVPFNIVNSTILAVVFWSQTGHDLLLGWLLALVILSAARVYHGRRICASGKLERNIHRGRLEFIIGAFLTGAAWGLGYIYIAAPAANTFKLLYLLVLGGMSAGAFSSMGTSTRVYILYLLPMLTPGCVLPLLERTAVGIAAGLMITLFMIMLILTHRVSSKMLTDGIRLKFENEELLHELSSANESLQKTNQALNQTKEDLQVISLTDELTGLSNRRHFKQLSKREWSRARRQLQTIACMMIDVDRFKQYNDYYGHQKGDECLADIADVLKRSIQRPEDILARYGGEEFIALLPNTALPGAVLVAERMINLLAEVSLPHVKSPTGTVTVSIGIATIDDEGSGELDDLIKSADEALYSAKENGRNRLMVSNSAISL